MFWTKRPAGTASGRRRIGKRVAAVASATVALAALLAGCTGGGPSSGDAGGGESETLTLALAFDPGTLDWTAIPSGGAPLLLLQTPWESLMRQTPEGGLEPGAAESYEVNEDYTQYTFTLREGMKFSDGSAVDAAASKASLEHMRDSGSTESVYLAGAEITTPDDLTVQISLPAPSKLLPLYLSVASGVIANPATMDDADAGPQGSGPYQLDEKNTTTGSVYTFVRNEHYWNPDAYPYDKVVYKVLTDPTAALSALQTGQVDGTFVPTQSVSQVENGDFNLAQVEVNWAGLHIFDRAGQLVPALGDVRVRQAMNMVFDREAIIDALFQGNGVVTNQIFNSTNGNAGYDPELADVYPFDVEAAKELMEEAGYADGFDLQLPKVPGFDAANPLIVQQLGELNINVTQVDVPLANFGDILQGKYPIFYFTLGSDPLAQRILDDALRPYSIWNPLKSQTPELDALLAEADGLPFEEADATYKAISKYLVEQAWYSPWALITDTWAFTSDVEATPCVGNNTPFLYAIRPAE